MPPIRDHDDDGYDQEMYFEEDDDDGMPSMVERPEDDMPTLVEPVESTSTSGTYMVFDNMPPITFDTTQFQSTAPISFQDSPDAAALPAPSPRASHGKKRDPSYIPRPPNAFILFRSSFIRSQQVPENVEGNHSTLSKIIGRYWKTLPKEEREEWEAKAVVAQAEHRRRYPDWRFRPGMTKLKTKDGTGRGRGKGRKKPVNDEASGGRLAKITDLLVEGKKGEDLFFAVDQWERESDRSRKRNRANPSSAGPLTGPLTGLAEPTTGGGGVRGSSTGSDATVTEPGSRRHAHSTSTSTTTSTTNRFKIPLTSMFKRSLSAPATHTRRGATWQEEENRRRIGVAQGLSWDESDQQDPWPSPSIPGPSSPQNFTEVAQPFFKSPPYASTYSTLAGWDGPSSSPGPSTSTYPQPAYPTPTWEPASWQKSISAPAPWQPQNQFQPLTVHEHAHGELDWNDRDDDTRKSSSTSRRRYSATGHAHPAQDFRFPDPAQEFRTPPTGDYSNQHQQPN